MGFFFLCPSKSLSLYGLILPVCGKVCYVYEGLLMTRASLQEGQPTIRPIYFLAFVSLTIKGRVSVDCRQRSHVHLKKKFKNLGHLLCLKGPSWFYATIQTHWLLMDANEVFQSFHIDEDIELDRRQKSDSFPLDDFVLFEGREARLWNQSGASGPTFRKTGNHFQASASGKKIAKKHVTVPPRKCKKIKYIN